MTSKMEEVFLAILCFLVVRMPTLSQIGPGTPFAMIFLDLGTFVGHFFRFYHFMWCCCHLCYASFLQLFIPSYALPRKWFPPWTPPQVNLTVWSTESSEVIFMVNCTWPEDTENKSPCLEHSVARTPSVNSNTCKWDSREPNTKHRRCSVRGS